MPVSTSMNQRSGPAGITRIRRDRDNIDLLKINIAKLERDLQELYDEE